jgi:hypothetical protein
MTREERIEAALATVGKTTPGPWYACCHEDEAHSHYVFSPGEGVICGMRQNDPNDDYENNYEPLEDTITHSERQANSRLIMASPDLRDEVVALRQLAKQVPRAMLEEVFIAGIKGGKDQDHLNIDTIADKYGYTIKE